MKVVSENRSRPVRPERERRKESLHKSMEEEPGRWTAFEGGNWGCLMEVGEEAETKAMEVESEIEKENEGLSRRDRDR